MLDEASCVPLATTPSHIDMTGFLTPVPTWRLPKKDIFMLRPPAGIVTVAVSPVAWTAVVEVVVIFAVMDGLANLIAVADN
jgi:hypothetical protein